MNGVAGTVTQQVGGRVVSNLSAVFGVVFGYAMVTYAIYMISERGKNILHSPPQTTHTPISSPSPNSSPTHNLFKGVFTLQGHSPTVPRRGHTPSSTE